MSQEWAKPGDRGRACRLRVDDLKIDHCYQRESLRTRAITDMAKDFNWRAFGALTVMERSDGSFYIIDGQQRWLAAKLRGDINTVPAVVFESAGRDSEARAFVALNVRRVPVTPRCRFYANSTAGAEPETTIARWLADNDMCIEKSSNTRANEIGFPTCLIKTWKRDPDICKKAILLQRQIIGQAEQMNEHIHRGMFHLMAGGIDLECHAEKLMVLGGKPAMLREIKAESIRSALRGSERVCAKGILNLVNYNRKNKIRMPAERAQAIPKVALVQGA